MIPNLSKQKLEEIIETPMGDDDIHHYFPDAKIMKYNVLNNYNDIDELLTEPLDYAFLLYEQSPNSGHWCVISKYDDMYEFFDPYGETDESILKWESKETNEELGQGKPTLSNLFKKEKNKLIINNIDYQLENPDINTCGRHCCFRILNLINYNRNLDEYHQLMNFIKKKFNMPYDIIVSEYITKL